MNLLEKMKLIAEGNKIALEDSPDICSAVLAAMEEIREDHKKAEDSTEDDFDMGYTAGVGSCVYILRKHLEGEANHDQ